MRAGPDEELEAVLPPHVVSPPVRLLYHPQHNPCRQAVAGPFQEGPAVQGRSRIQTGVIEGPRHDRDLCNVRSPDGFEVNMC